jgi:hypothetical protein
MPKSLSVLLGSRVLRKKNGPFQQYHEKILSTLQSDSFSRGASFEKLRATTGPYLPFSFRLNEKIRAIVTKVIIQNQPYWVLLDVMLDHRYNREIFLKPGHLKTMLEDDWDFISQQIDVPAKGFEQLEETSLPVEELTYYNQQYMRLNSTQAQVLQSGQCKLVTGMPGSGKSLVAMSWMLKKLYEANEAQKILYVVQSARLAANMYRTWRSSPEYQAEHESKLSFQHYQQLFEISDKTVDKEDFYCWFIQHVSPEIQAQLKPKNNHATLQELMYQEMRMMTGFTQEEYINRSQRHTLFRLETASAVLWTIYQDYMAHLQTHRLMDMSFHHYTGAMNLYDHVIIDEAQDLSPRQLQNIVSLAQNKQVSCFMDSHQSLHDSVSKVHMVKQLLGVEHIECHELMETKRCPKKVIEFANQVLNLKYAVTGGVLEKDGYCYIPENAEPNEGQFIWMDHVAESLHQLKASIDGDADTVVVTSLQLLEEAQAHFPSNMVLTAEQIKGLEFPRVIAYRLLEQDAFYPIHQSLRGRKEIQSPDKVGRAKRGEEQDELAPICNQFFITATRAMDTLVVMENKRHAHHYICDFLRPKAIDLQQQAAPLEIKPERSKPEDWQRRIEDLLCEGLFDEAWRMAKMHLNYRIRDFQALCSKFSEAPTSSSQRFFKSEPKNETVLRLSVEEKKFLTDYLGTEYDKAWEFYVAERQLVDRDDLLKPLENGQSTFSWMCDKEAFLLELFSRQPLKLLAISREVLLAHPPGRYDLSALFQLSRTKEGIMTLRRILNMSPHIMHTLTMHDLCQSTNDVLDEVQNTSVLYNLCYERQGVELLNEWVQVNPSIISVDAFFRLSLTNWHTGDSPFHTLCIKSPFSKALLEKLIEHRQDIFDAMTYEHLFRRFDCRIPSPLKNSSPFYWLARCEHQMDLLWDILKNKYDLFSQIKMSDLVTLVHPKPQETTSVFFYLCRQMSLDSMFCTMIQESNLMDDPLMKDAIIQENKINQQKTYPLFWLTESQYGCDSLKMILENDENLQKISFAHLTHKEITVPDSPDRTHVIENLLEANRDDIIARFLTINTLVRACVERYLEHYHASHSGTLRIDY